MNMVYARFKDDSIYHLYNAKIEYDPNQQLWLNVGYKTQGLKFTSIPVEPMKIDGAAPDFLNGQPRYILKFENILPERFLNEPFWIGDIKFMLTRYTYDPSSDHVPEAIAEGFYKNYENKNI